MHKKIKVNIILKAAVSFAVAIIVFLTSFFSLFHNLDAQLLTAIHSLDDRLCDWLYQSEDVAYLPITLVMIDDNTMDAIGQQTEWSRQVYADLINAVVSDGYSPAVISFDIQFTGQKDEAGDRAFVEAAKRAGNIVVGSMLEYDKVIISDNGPGSEGAVLDEEHIKTVNYPYSDLLDVVSTGFTNEQSESGNYVRTVITVAEYEDEWLDCFALATLKKFVRHYNDDPERKAKHPEFASLNVDGFTNNDITKFRFSYTSSPNSDAVGDHVSLVDILEGRYKPAQFNNRILLVGNFAPGLKDYFNVPIPSKESVKQNSMYGVEIHANIIQALADGKLQTDFSKGSQALISLVFSLIAGLFCFFMFTLRIRFGGLTGILLESIIIISGKILYSNGLYLYVLIPMSMLAFIYIGFIIFFYSVTKLEKSKINKAFKMYVAPEIVEEVASEGDFKLQLGGRNKDIAVLFVDIRGFTTMSESLKPEEVVEVLNEYFAIVTDAIFKNKGTLDKFIGDAAMAVFNSPFDLDDYVYRAVCTARDIAAGSDLIRDKFLERFGKTVNYGIGVNCGEATIGNIGSPFRMDYTAIGDTVNTAARLESNAPAGSILISEEVKQRLGDRIKTEEVGEIPLKGKKVGIMVYRVLEVY